MLSKNMTVSLMSLITIIALAFAVPSAMADPFEIKIAGPTKANYAVDNNNAFDPDGEVKVRLKVSSGQPIADLVLSSTPAATDTIKVYRFNKAGFITASDLGSVTVSDLPKSDTVNDPPEEYPMKTPKEHQLLVTIIPGATDTTIDNVIQKVIIEITGGIASTDPTLKTADAKSKADPVRHTITLSAAADTTDLPKVISIQRLREGSQTVVAAFQEEVVTDASFNVRFVLSEGHSEYDGGKTADENAKRLIEVSNGVPSNLVVGVPFARSGAGLTTTLPHPLNGGYDHNLSQYPGAATSGTDVVPDPTGTDEMYRQYRVTITPHTKKGDPAKTFPVKIKVKNFHDGGAPIRNTYVSPGFGESVNLPNGREILTVNVAYTSVDLKAGYRVAIPKEIHIPGGGYLIVAKNKAGSEVDTTGQDADRTKDAPRATFRTPAQLKYNVHEASTLPNLATQFLNGVVVDVESGNKLYITEVMWGEDVSLNPSSNSQWIELYNPGAGFNTPDDDASTHDVDERLTLVFYAPNEFGSVAAATADATTGAMTLPGRVVDRIGTLDAKGAYWSPATKGSSGRSGTGEAESVVGRTTPTTVEIISMYRGMVPDTSTGAAADAMMPADGQMAKSWESSAGPKSANFDPTALGIRHGTPGAATDATDTPADTAAAAKAKADAAAAAAKKTASTGTIPTAGQIYISEIMFAGAGSLPQWIEISNGSATEDINLSGWTLKIENANSEVAGSDNIGPTATFTIPDGTTIDQSRQTGADKTPSTILVVSETGRHDLGKGAGQVVNLSTDNEVELILAGVTDRRYTLLSDEAFMITLAPPAYTPAKLAATATAAQKAEAKATDALELRKRVEATDMVGNLGTDGTAAWALPTNADGGRSSIIRDHVNVDIGPSEPNDGTMEANWHLASDTAFADGTHGLLRSYYGARSDIGTPGFRAGGALPVELSHFRPARQKETGQVVITWSTQSELNNAGFFIKRSQQKDGEFKVINAAMVPGAGTTSEKQFYTYTDTTAQPNVVYYYQIEDVSLDGNRQTLTRGIRLKGHVSVAGKATLTWGELKTSHE